MNEKSNGYIHARQLKEKLENILNITLSESSIQKYRHNVIRTNFRRCRFAPKIFTKEEKVNRLTFCLNKIIKNKKKIKNSCSLFIIK